MVVVAFDPDVGLRAPSSSAGVSSSKITTASTAASAASTRARSVWPTRGRSGPLARRTDASELRQTTSASPSARAASSSSTWPRMQQIEAAAGGHQHATGRRDPVGEREGVALRAGDPDRSTGGEALASTDVARSPTTDAAAPARTNSRGLARRPLEWRSPGRRPSQQPGAAARRRTGRPHRRCRSDATSGRELVGRDRQTGRRRIVLNPASGSTAPRSPSVTATASACQRRPAAGLPAPAGASAEPPSLGRVRGDQGAARHGWRTPRMRIPDHRHPSARPLELRRSSGQRRHPPAVVGDQDRPGCGDGVQDGTADGRGPAAARIRCRAAAAARSAAAIRVLVTVPPIRRHREHRAPGRPTGPAGSRRPRRGRER